MALGVARHDEGLHMVIYFLSSALSSGDLDLNGPWLRNSDMLNVFHVVITHCLVFLFHCGFYHPSTPSLPINHSTPHVPIALPNPAARNIQCPTTPLAIAPTAANSPALTYPHSSNISNAATLFTMTAHDTADAEEGKS